MKPRTKAPVEIVQRFTGPASTLDGVELRRMFGYPVAFAGGNSLAPSV